MAVLRSSRILKSFFRMCPVAFNSKVHTAPAFVDGILHSPLQDVEIPNVSFTDYIFDYQERYADKICLVEGETGESFKHGQVRDNILRLASGLTKLGVGKDVCVGIVASNSPQYAFALLAVAATGGRSTTVNNASTEHEILRQLENSEASFAICDSSFLPLLRRIKKQLGLKEIIVIGEEADDTHSLMKIISANSALSSYVKICPDDVVVVPYSSGTTGLPKGVMLTNRNLVANLRQVMDPSLVREDSFADANGNQEIMVGLLPMFHIYGMIPMLCLNFILGGKMVTLRKFIPDQYTKILKDYKPTYLHSVPPLINFMANTDSVKPEYLENVRTIVCGAAPCGSSLIDRFMKKFEGVTWQEGYGMTEASPVTHMTPLTKSVRGTVGISIPNTLSKIVDTETGRTLGPGEGSGELCVKGPQVMKGYYKNEQATRETICEDNWLHTGDIAIMDDDYNVSIVDRVKELIKVKGFQVAPAELENLIKQHDKVMDVAVVGIPDEKLGERPKAFVVPMKGLAIAEGEIEEYVSKFVSPHKQLTGGVAFIDQIPKSATGKIIRKDLKAMATS